MPEGGSVGAEPIKQFGVWTRVFEVAARATPFDQGREDTSYG